MLWRSIDIGNSEIRNSQLRGRGLCPHFAHHSIKYIAIFHRPSIDFLFCLTIITIYSKALNGINFVMNLANYISTKGGSYEISGSTDSCENQGYVLA